MRKRRYSLSGGHANEQAVGMFKIKFMIMARATLLLGNPLVRRLYIFYIKECTLYERQHVV